MEQNNLAGDINNKVPNRLPDTLASRNEKAATPHTPVRSNPNSSNQVQNTQASQINQATPVATPANQNENNSEQSSIKQNKISAQYEKFMSPKPLETGSLKLLIVIGIVSVIIYIATRLLG